MSEWQPIESAPKEQVLLYFPAYKSAHHPSNDRREMFEVGFAPGHPNRKATHWQPLPQPPS